MAGTRPQSAKHRGLSLPSSIEEHWHAEPSGDAPEDAVPFFVLAGLMGSERSGKQLPSHAGSSMPTRFDAPIAGHGRSSLFLAPGPSSVPPVVQDQPLLDAHLPRSSRNREIYDDSAFMSRQSSMHSLFTCSV